MVSYLLSNYLYFGLCISASNLDYYTYGGVKYQLFLPLLQKCTYILYYNQPFP